MGDEDGRDLSAGLPPDWREQLSGCELVSVERGMSSATLVRVRGGGFDNAFLKLGEGDAAADLRREIERTRWLAARGLRVPALIRASDDGRRVAALMTALPGVHPQEGERPADELVAVLGRALAAFHAEPAESCPFDESIATRLTRAAEAIVSGGVNPMHFAERNRAATPGQIHNRLAAIRPRSEDTVLVHGDATFDNILIDGADRVGFIDCGHSGRGDRMLDLVTLVSDIEECFGVEWVAPFLAAYGAGWNPANALFFSDLYELF